ncbi:sensor histidine kinase [Caballeronia sp. M1242]|uniref:sensor histidine kinase n=1 Tax=Caballeronia sp. M1242 TaxID=2814653 RepID=UPI0019D1468F|nr:sensor histidine kinase [Caballeronia sp. M1242]QSN60788.1 sensor histidine kinase [Caballeronia sp. M1242]
MSNIKVKVSLCYIARHTIRKKIITGASGYAYRRIASPTFGVDMPEGVATRNVQTPRSARLNRWSLCWLGLMLWFLSNAIHAGEPWRVVILPGADPTQPAVAIQIRALRSALTAAAPDGVEFYTDSLDELRFDSSDLTPQFLALLKKKYENKRIDLVIGIADFALDFTTRYHTDIWPKASILITSIDESRVARIPPDFAYIAWHFDADNTIALAEAIQPHATQLVIVAGNSNFDDFTARLAEQAARSRRSRNWDVKVWSGLTLNELQGRLNALDASTAAVVYTTMYRDREGRTFFPFEVVAPIARASRAPIYGWYPTYLDQGLIGGAVISYEDNGRRAGGLAASILLGKVSAHGATLPTMRSRCIVDRTQSDRLAIHSSLIPDDCEQINVPPSLWNQYRGTVLFVAAVVGLQALTIAALLWQHRKRRFAEEAATVRANELARAARISSAGELSASIAHEVGQPLGAILSNADAAGLILEHGEPEVPELQQILADVRRDAARASQVVQRLRDLLRKQPVEFIELNLNSTVEETLTLLAPEARRRRIAIESELAPACPDIVGDRIQLQQVLLNLSVNAMDAMHETEHTERLLTILTRPGEHGIELTVADRGHGIPEAMRSTLFDSFATTKPHGMGLGLSIARTIVELHGGTIVARSREGGGSEFVVWLPSASRSRFRAQHKPDRNAARET